MKTEDIQIEIEELAMQLADMLGAALHFAGVKDKNMARAVEIYLDEFEKIHTKECGYELCYEDIVKIIDGMKNSHPSLFT